MGKPLGSDDYREGALVRLDDAIKLYEQNRWVGAIYLAGRAVEAILRSLLWLKSQQQEKGHDLKGLLARTRVMGLIGPNDTKLKDDINDVAVVWRNNLRFVGDNRLLRDLKALGRDKRVGHKPVKGNVHKANAKHMVETCEAIVARGDKAWQRYRTN